MTFERHELELHGQRVSYRAAGSGPALLLLHGIANSSDTWARVAPLLSDRFTLIAPDLLGHGESATPRGDYSLGAHASGARDVATALGHDRVTVVGHSLGGGIAMQFAYQFPERTSGSCWSPAAASAATCTCCCAPPRSRAPTSSCRAHLAAPRRPRARPRRPARDGRAASVGDIAVLARGFAELDNAGSRQAFLHTLRAVSSPAASASAPPAGSRSPPRCRR